MFPVGIHLGLTTPTAIFKITLKFVLISRIPRFGFIKYILKYRWMKAIIYLKSMFNFCVNLLLSICSVWDPARLICDGLSFLLNENQLEEILLQTSTVVWDCNPCSKILGLIPKVCCIIIIIHHILSDMDPQIFRSQIPNVLRLPGIFTL